MSETGSWLEVHRDAGAVTGVVGGVERPRHYGDPAAEYRAATGGAAVADRSFRARLAVLGRAPGDMLKGVVTGRLPDPPAPGGEAGLLRSEAPYNLVLTPKGRIVSDLRVLPAGEEADGGLLLDVPAEGAAALREHLTRYLPPRFAEVEDRSAGTGMLTALGPGAAELLSRDVLGLRAEAADLEALPEGGVLLVPGAAIQVVRAGGFATPAWDVVADRGTVAALWTRLLGAGAAPAGHGVLETLRVEAGRPRFGAELDDSMLPPEAGLAAAFDHGKGCYTGQEVIVRIRDRGHVNRHLRGLELGEAAAPSAGSHVYRPGGERPVGRVTTAVQSPRMGGAVALAYVRREVEPPADVAVGGPDGAPARVRSLEGWGPA